MMSDQYFAGLFDGEGSIGARMHWVRPNGKYSYHRLQINLSIGQAHATLPLLMSIQAQYGGRMYTQKKREVSYQDQSRIIWSALNDMKSILCKIEPHLIGKREQAKLALWWLKNIYHDDIHDDEEAARNTFIADLQAMKKNMLLTADSSIIEISKHLGHKMTNTVVAIR